MRTVALKGEIEGGVKVEGERLSIIEERRMKERKKKGSWPNRYG
jgi:hypothetical protein